MIVDPAVLPGLVLLGAELAALAAVGYVVVRVALRQDDELSALAQGLVVGPSLWGIVVNFVMYAVPGMAGAAVGWTVMLLLAAGLAWRAPGRLRPPARTVAGFAGAVLVLSWVALASRQLVGIANPHTDLALAASIGAGGFPVALPGHPESSAAYHYGASLLAGLLAPPLGPNLAFVWELVGVFAWVGFALVVATALRQRGSWFSVLLLTPLLLSYGLHTFVWVDPGKVQGILHLPIPVGLPTEGLRASLAYIYWPPVEPIGSRLSALPDVWKPAFPLGYAVAFVVLAHAARPSRSTWTSSLTLAGLVGFLGLLVTTLAPVVAVLWASLEAAHLALTRRAGTATLARARHSGAAMAAAGLLLVFGGGALSGILGGGAGSSGLTWTHELDAGHWSVLGSLGALAGGVGLLSLGPLAIAGIATALAPRDRLVLVLAAAASLLAFAWLVLDYPPRPEDIRRLAGHARNLALVAVVLALSSRLASAQLRRLSLAVGALLAGLVVWPTVAAPAHSLGIALGHGVQLANAGSERLDSHELDRPAAWPRHRMPGMSSRLAAYIRQHTATDARVLDTSDNLTVVLNTGRPNNWGFTDVVQLTGRFGPEYLDARFYLEPAAFRRLGLEYVYATDEWVDFLPERARGWLADPRFFDLAVRDGHEALYRVRPRFLALETAPHSSSYEVLRAVPPATTIYLQPMQQDENQVRLLRIASVLSHARLFGAVNSERLHLRTPAPWTVTPLGEQVPDLVAMPLMHRAWAFPPAAWKLAWSNPPDRVAIYAPTEADDHPTAPVPTATSVRLADVRIAEAGLSFTATFDDPGKIRWTGQDWVLVPTDATPLAIPIQESFHGLPLIEQWFAGQAAGAGTTTHSYLFDARTSTLAVLGADGAYATVQASDRTPSPGSWMLALRLTRRTDNGVQETVRIIPVLHFTVSKTGTIASTQVYEISRGWRPI